MKHARGSRLAARHTRKRPRLAFVSPLPPERTGVAGYSAALLPQLLRWYDIEVVTNQTDLADDWIRTNCAVTSVEEFLTRADGYDRILYQFGNSSFHHHMFDLLEAWPGVVVLHDFFLSHAVAGRDRTGRGRAAFAHSLYESHGYPALAGLYRPGGMSEALWRYPLNLQILQRALGVIVHSRHALDLVARWYGEQSLSCVQMIPLAQAPRALKDRDVCREALGFGKEDLVVCALGSLGMTKSNHKLVEAWLSSPLAAHPKAHLLFVGDGLEGRYGQLLTKLVMANGAEGRIRFTGWTDQEAFGRYLAAADMAVQLRALSRGETPAATLDALSCGVATLVNAHGSSAELDPESVCTIRDDFTRQELAEALFALATDPARRKRIGARAREAVRKHHSVHVYAECLHQWIETAYRRAGPVSRALLEAASSERFTRRMAAASAATLARHLPPKPRVARWLVDISELARNDAKTGIQRVARAILLEWLRSPPNGFRVEPVYASPATGGYRHARRFTHRFLNLPVDWVHDDLVEVWPGDVFVGLDWSAQLIPERKATLQQWRASGARVWSVLYDLLPAKLPHCFTASVSSSHRRWLETICTFDGIACISQAVENDLRAWFIARSPGRFSPLSIVSFPLGADVNASRPTKGFSDGATEALAVIGKRPSFLMVGTIEPRKGHAQTLAAFELLWARGIHANLVIVGKRGWMVDELATDLDTHAENGKRLLCLGAVSDEYLEQLYAASTCLIAASIDEGFGLPLIEAARHSLPVIARDIPVFREVAGAHATYFAGDGAEPLAQTVLHWLQLFKIGRHPRTDGMTWSTWQDSAKALANEICKQVPRTPGGVIESDAAAADEPK